MLNTNLTGEKLNIYDFQAGVLNGKYSDAKGYAQLMINGRISNMYIVHIDRRIVSNSNSIVSFSGLLKEHGPEKISILYVKKDLQLPDLDEYLAYKNQVKNNRSNSFGPKKGSKRYV